MNLFDIKEIGMEVKAGGYAAELRPSVTTKFCIERERGKRRALWLREPCLELNAPIRNLPALSEGIYALHPILLWNTIS